ncbi:MAG: PEP-CTERM sorting domain-containing protein [Planctomycetota bacterium]
MAIIPEPVTVLLLALGVSVLLRKRRQSSIWLRIYLRSLGCKSSAWGPFFLQ